MDYLSVKDFAIKWNISVRRIQFLCENNKIPGVKLFGKSWGIPINAEKPVDNRTKSGKAQSQYQYKFPLLIHSPYCSYPEQLTEEEKDLLQMQIFYLQGSYEKSIDLCREIIHNYNIPYIKIGAYLGLCYNSLLSGQLNEFKINKAKLTDFITQQTDHQEDYRLLLLGLELQQSFYSNDLIHIDLSKLSDGANDYFQSLLLLSIFINKIKIYPQTLKAYEIYCNDLLTKEMFPTAITVSVLVSFLYYRNNDAEIGYRLCKQACTLAKKYNYLNHLANYKAILNDPIDSFFQANNPSVVKQINEYYAKNIRNRKNVTSHLNGQGFFDKIDIKYENILILLYYDVKEEDIAHIKNIGLSDMKNILAELCKQVNVPSKKELLNFLKQLSFSK